MKIFIVILCSLALVTQGIAQDSFTGRAIEDYSKLRKMIKDKSFDSNKIKKEDYEIDSLKAYFDAHVNDNVRVLDASSVISAGITGLNASTAIGTLSNFIIGRAKDEANIAYLNRFTEFMNNNNILELKLLLPETRKKLTAVKDEIYDYKNFFPSLQVQFKKDFENLPANFQNVFDDNSTFIDVNVWGKTIRDNKPYFAFAFDVLDSFKQKQTGISFLEKTRTRNYFSVITTKLLEENAQIVLAITDLAFHSNSSSVDLDKLTKDDLGVFLTLLKASKKNKSTRLVGLDTNKLVSIGNSLFTFSESLNQQPNKRDFNTFLNAFTKLINDVTNAGIGKNSELIKYVLPASKVIEGISNKDYSVAISGIINLANEWANNAANNKKTIDKLKKYLTFMANVINAKDSDGMLAALQAAALPVRSYQMKRYNEFTWTVGALGGLGYRSSTNKVGIYAPIGLDFAWGKKGAKKGSNIGFSILLIDISAVTALRLIGNQDPLPDLTWGNVFAPGAFFNWGIRNQPLTVSAGWQYGPGLIEIKNNQAVITERKGTVMVGVSFDIPIFKIVDKK
jgi:hypothetical protein